MHFDLTPSEWGLYTVDREARAAEVAAELDAAVHAAFVAAGIANLRRPAIIKAVAAIYSPLAVKYAKDGFGDTEGRYGIETAAVRYLHANHRYEVAESLLDDFLLWEA